MATSLAKAPESTGLAARYGLTNEQLDAFRAQIAPPNAPDSIIELFFIRCRQLGADPWGRLLSIIPRPFKTRGSRGEDVWDTKYSIEGTIDLFRALAEASGQYNGQDKPIINYDKSGKVVSSTVTVYRKDIDRPFVAEAFLEEYYQEKSPVWNKMPRNQLSKCAEALAFRKAFPQKLNGIYTADEMGQAEVHNVTPVEPPGVAALPAGTQVVQSPIDLELEKGRKTVRAAIRKRAVPEAWLLSFLSELPGAPTISGTALAAIDELSVEQLRLVFERIVARFPTPGETREKAAQTAVSTPNAQTVAQQPETPPKPQQTLEVWASDSPADLEMIEFFSENALGEDEIQEACARVTARTERVRYHWRDLSPSEREELKHDLTTPLDD